MKKTFLMISVMFIFSTFSKAQWEIVKDNPVWGNAWSIDAFDTSSMVVGANRGGLYFKTAENSWDSVYFPKQYVYDVEMISKNIVLVGTGEGFGNIYKVNLTDKSKTLLFTNPSKDCINYIEIFEDGSGIAMGDGDFDQNYPVLLKTEDWGESWETIETGELMAATGDLWRRVDFLSTEVGYLQPCCSFNIPRGIYKTTDGGLTWNQVGSNEVMNFKFYNEDIGLTYDGSSFENEDTLYYKGVITRTLDGGETWEVTDTLEKMGWGQDFEFLLGDPSKVWFSNGSGLYHSSDTGRTWEKYNDNNLPLNASDIVFIDHQNGFAVGGIGVILKTNNGGGLITKVEDVNSAPINFSLMQNYPNPFNPATKISFSIPELADVQLKIFDVLGREVSLLINEEKPAGNYEVEFNASKLASGIYFYRLKSGKFIDTKKMTLIR